MEYQVDLTAFRGPLDLLLYLVKHNEVDICDIPIARITEQFLDYLNVLQVDRRRGGRRVPGHGRDADGDQEPAAAAAGRGGGAGRTRTRGWSWSSSSSSTRSTRKRPRCWSEQAQQQLARCRGSRSRRPAAPTRPSSRCRKVELWDLVSAFGRLMRETVALQPKQIVDRRDAHARPHGPHPRPPPLGARASPSTKSSSPWTRGRLVGLFLAILELIKGKRVYVEQPALFGEIWVCLGEQAG